MQLMFKRPELKMAIIKSWKISEFYFALLYASTLLLCYQAQNISVQTDEDSVQQVPSFYLPQAEMNALAEIAQQLGKTNWDFNLNPCDNNSNWVTPERDDMPLYSNTVLCSNCSHPDSVCHIHSIILKGQDLAGVLPPSLAKLPYIKYIDLTRNYLNGTIPLEWVSTNLEHMDVTVNRLSGPIPKYLGNMTSLVNLSLENNQFSGMVPAELGNLANLTMLVLSANSLTGKLPWQLNKLSKIKQFWLSGNNFTGKLPRFSSWPNIERLDIQACGLQGPLPSSISTMTKLRELRITDLNGGGISQLPFLGSMKSMKRLILRSCNISGEISNPQYFADMPNLQNLDLSFNNLSGEIPDLHALKKLQNLILTSNSFTGEVPEWINNMESKVKIDLSYNNFQESSGKPPPQYRPSVNLYRSYGSGRTSQFSNYWSRCTKVHRSFHVNCGGKHTKINKTEYEGDDDESSKGSAGFYSDQTKIWGTSTTGYFVGLSSGTIPKYVTQNVSVLTMNESELYTTARLSPISLTYYGHCLANGNYNVRLHFAEIKLRNDQSFQSLGKRLFDVYIQGEKKIEDFNIEQQANGVDKPVIRNFYATVTNKILEIRLQHKGKGTTAVPERGTYGPLISAISVEADFKPPPNERVRNILIETGTSLLGLCLILGVASFFLWKYYKAGKIAREKELRGLDLREGFTYRQIKAATNNFDPDNKIGQGGFGSVYKGTLLDGTFIAVKQLTSKSRQGNEGFVNEIGVISALQHPNLVKLHGCCIEGSELLLVYEYMENNSLARALYGPEEWQLDMDWSTRKNICIGIAKGLAFMHEESPLKIVHRDIKPENVLLDEDLNPKISDFGLAKLDDEENTHISTKVAGTMGYMAPEYALWGHLTHKADVYSYGVVALEVVAAKCNMDCRPNGNFICLLDWAIVLQENGNVMDLVDPKLGADIKKDEVERVIRVALLCTSQSPSVRPNMSEVVSMLQGDMSINDMDPNINDNES